MIRNICLVLLRRSDNSKSAVPSALLDQNYPTIPPVNWWAIYKKISLLQYNRSETIFRALQPSTNLFDSTIWRDSSV